MYMPKLARFTARDPMPVDGTALLGGPPSHAYSYVDNNPVNLIDPSGLFATPIITCLCACIPPTAPEEKCPECPDPWEPKDIPGPLKNFKYGCYCGKEPVPKRKKIPPPIDATDACCKKHDSCCGKAKSKADKKKCNEDLTKCVEIAIIPEDNNKERCSSFSKDLKCCVKAANKILNWYRAAGSKYC